MTDLEETENLWKIYGKHVGNLCEIHGIYENRWEKENRKSMDSMGHGKHVGNLCEIHGIYENRWEKENRKSMDSMGHGKYVGNLWEIIQDGPPPVMFVGL